MRYFVKNFGQLPLKKWHSVRTYKGKKIIIYRSTRNTWIGCIQMSTSIDVIEHENKDEFIDEVREYLGLPRQNSERRDDGDNKCNKA